MAVESAASPRGRPATSMVPRTEGFTLVEISIVLVIIGLVVGGVVLGSHLVKAAQTRGLITEMERYAIAVNTFKVKYNCLPGDCGNATSLFGTAADCSGNSAITSGTCNGNGNGWVDGIFNCYQEQYLAAQQLVAARLISTQLTNPGQCGVQADGNGLDVFLPGANVAQALSFPGVGINFAYFAPGVGCAADFALLGTAALPPCRAGNYLSVGTAGVLSVMGQESRTGFDAVTVFLIDTKLDDGLPYTGRLLCAGSDRSCGTAPVATGTYKTDSGDNAQLYFVYMP